MPWCPKCKNEYREGNTVCSDCGCALVEELEEELREDVPVAFDTEEAAGVPEFFDMEEIEEVTPIAPSVLYENSAAKAEDNKLSAFTLLLVGIVGMAVVILGLLGVLPFQLTGTTKYMTYGIMSALFLLFIVMGLVSMKSYRIFAKKAESENNIRNTMEKWCLETLHKEALDQELFSEDEDVAEEIKYFRRTALLKEKIAKQFVNLDQAFLDNFVDELYEDIFEDK